VRYWIEKSVWQSHWQMNGKSRPNTKGFSIIIIYSICLMLQSYVIFLLVTNLLLIILLFSESMSAV
jgi:hypothetical protein